MKETTQLSAKPSSGRVAGGMVPILPGNSGRRRKGPVDVAVRVTSCAFLVFRIAGLLDEGAGRGGNAVGGRRLAVVIRK